MGQSNFQSETTVGKLRTSSFMFFTKVTCACWLFALLRTNTQGLIFCKRAFLKVCWPSGNRGISAPCIIMLFWTTGKVPFFLFQMIVIAQWFVNMIKTTVWVLWINANCGFFIFLYWNQCVFRGARKHLKTPILTQDHRQSTLFVPFMAGGGSQVSTGLR